jgi:hypothetical protein
LYEKWPAWKGVETNRIVILPWAAKASKASVTAVEGFAKKIAKVFEP